MRFLVVKAWGKPECERAPGKRSFFWCPRGWGAIHGRARGIRGVGTAAGSVHNDIDGGELVWPWTCATTRLLTSVRVSSCHRLGQMTHLTLSRSQDKAAAEEIEGRA